MVRSALQGLADARSDGIVQITTGGATYAAGPRADMALGAPEDDEMSGMMITRGWRIKLEAQGKTYEYRADKNQVRLHNFKGKNYRI